jgi:cytochrome c55X
MTVAARRVFAAIIAAGLGATAPDGATGGVPGGDPDAAGPVAVAFVPPPAPRSERQRELLQLLKQDCGSCHGMRLTGGLGPPLTSEALRTKPAASLVATIVSGRPGTAMPPWRRFVSEAEAEWLVARMIVGDVDVFR